MARKRKPKFTLEQISAAESQISLEQRAVDYNVNEYVVEVLYKFFSSKEEIERIEESERIIVIPDYQRRFIWDKNRQSKFIESLILGLPIPFLFSAERPDGRMEVLDGAQRLMTIEAFLDGELRLRKLSKLSTLNGFSFEDLPVSQQRKLRGRSIRMIVLSEASDPLVRFDLFERINSGSVRLSDAEFRKGAFPEGYYPVVRKLADYELFHKLCVISNNKIKRGEYEELALRFFAYKEAYKNFKHDVANFLNEFVVSKISKYNPDEMESEFYSMLDFVEKNFPFGFKKSRNINDTPRVRFEAISVGVHLALKENPALKVKDVDWLNSKEFEFHTTTHASNSGPRLVGRIEYVRDQLLGA